MAFRRYGTAVFSILFLLLVSYQSILLTVVPLEAHEVLGNAQRVSEIYLAVGITTMLGRQSIPWLVSVLGRKRTFAAGCGAMIVGVGLLTQRSVASLIPGMVLTTLSFAIIEVSLNLYLLDNMSRVELANFEPRRIVRTTPAWLVGPWLGVFSPLMSLRGCLSPLQRVVCVKFSKIGGAGERRGRTAKPLVSAAARPRSSQATWRSASFLRSRKCSMLR